MVALIEKVHFNKADFERPPLELFDKISGRTLPTYELPTEPDECRLKLAAEGPHSLHVSMRPDSGGQYLIVFTLFSSAYEPVMRAEMPFASVVAAYGARIQAGDSASPDITAMESARQDVELFLKVLLSPWLKGAGVSLFAILSRGLVRAVFNLRAALAEGKRVDLKKVAAHDDPYGGRHRSYDDHRKTSG